MKYCIIFIKYCAIIYESQAASERFFGYHYVIIPLILKNAYIKIAKYSLLSIMEVSIQDSPIQYRLNKFSKFTVFWPWFSYVSWILLQGGGIKRGGIRWVETFQFTLLSWPWSWSILCLFKWRSWCRKNFLSLSLFEYLKRSFLFPGQNVD